MNRNLRISNAILWAAAILSSAILHAPTSLTLILLPMLAYCALFLTGRRCQKADPC